MYYSVSSFFHYMLGWWHSSMLLHVAAIYSFLLLDTITFMYKFWYIFNHIYKYVMNKWCVYVEIIMSNDAKTIVVNMFWEKNCMYFFQVGIECLSFLEVKLLGHRAYECLLFAEKTTVFQSSWTNLYSYQLWMRTLFAKYLCQYLIIMFLFICFVILPIEVYYYAFNLHFYDN